MNRIKKELRSIKTCRELFSSIMKDVPSMSAIGTDKGDGKMLLNDLFEAFNAYKTNKHILICTNNTHIHTSYNLRKMLPPNISSIELGEITSIYDPSKNNTIDIIHLNTLKKIYQRVLEYDVVILQIPDRAVPDIKKLMKWHKMNTKTNIIITLECPDDKGFKFKDLCVFRTSINNILFMMYDEFEGDICFVDLFKRKMVLYNIKA